MKQEYLREFSEIATEKLNEWEANLAAATDPVDQLPAEDMVCISKIIVSHVTPSADETQLRDGIAELREAMASSLDAGAFMTAQNVIDVIHDILGDEVVDIGTVPRSVTEAVEFLARTIEADAKSRLRTEIIEGRGDGVRMSLKLGMSVRNSLRAAGFTELALGVSELDDIWFDLLERALFIQEIT